MSFLIESQQEFNGLKEIMDFDKELIVLIEITIDNEADNHTHMGITEFVDLCISVSRMEGHDGSIK